VKLADGKERTIQHMISTTFWHPDGTPMSAQQFMEALFGKLPEFFKDEAELRAIWVAPDTRVKLLQGLVARYLCVLNLGGGLGRMGRQWIMPGILQTGPVAAG
jgi:hypothetical protein